MYFLFFVLAAILLATALGVVLLRNPVHSAISLVANMLCVAGLFAMLEAHFLAVVQIIVYAGAVVVLFLFVVMLLNTKLETVRTRDVFSGIVGLVAGGVFLSALIPLFSGAFENIAATGPSLTGGEQVTGTVAAIGKVLFTDYLFPFEAASMLIMAALVGAVMLGHQRNDIEVGEE